MAMRLAKLRFGLQSPLSGGAGSGGSEILRRPFASSAHNDEREAEKWEKITYAGIATCTILAIYNLSKGHLHYEEPPPYPYLRIRNKEFPWGPDGLFEKKHN
ncbi:hypothetical protein Droror1_Dr00011066 [Drosera rotundifolia]